MTPACVACGRGLEPAAGGKGYRAVRCSRCGLRRIDPIPAAADLAEYYSRVYSLASDSARVDVAAYRAQGAAIAAAIQQWAPQARRLCEVGCSGGWALHELQRRGYTVKGYELSAATSRIAREELGLDVVTGEFTAAGETFDVVVMRHVLEHTTDPLAQLSAVAARLAPGGTLLLAVPNDGGIGSRLLGQYWSWYIPPAHIWYFTADSMRALAGRVGLDVRSIETRQGDANNPGVELAAGATRWLRQRTRSARPAPAAAGEVLGQPGWRGSVIRGANLALAPLSAVVSLAGLGDELWVAATKARAAG